MSKENKIELYLSETNSIFNEFENIINSLSQFRIQINTIQQQVKNVEKNVKKQMKTLQSQVNKNKNKGNKNPSGFATPTKITKELCAFMNKEEGTKMARTEVTSALSSYIKENNLQNQSNKKFILPDEKLKSLLGLTDDDKLTYFTLQKYMNKHFIRESTTN
jgi:upstream activation factor subunit UAF30